MINRIKRIHVGSVLGIAVAIYIAYYLIHTVHRNYQLQKEISTLDGQISQLETERESLKYKIQYYQTEEYKEKEARAKLGLQAPGEGVIILPHEDDKSEERKETKPKEKKSNLQQWFDFLRGRSTQ